MRSEEYRAKLDRLLDSRMQRLSGRAHKFCIRFGLPHLHVCWWDKHCQEFDAPRRITVLWGRYSVWVDVLDAPGRWLSFGRSVSSRN